MGYAINPCGIFDFANQTTHTDSFTFDKNTYQNARNYSPSANSQYAKQYLKDNPNKPYVRASNYSAKSSSSTYRVRKGDSLSKIASRNGTTVAKLCRLNGIKTTTKLQVGQRLKLR